jgi:alpha-ketoglutarate-dependent taurine dioxygenase
MSSLRVSPLPDAPFGAEVTGWDPVREPTDELVAQLRGVLADHVLLVLRGHQAPTDAELIRLAEAFGPLFDGGAIFGVTGRTKEILELSSERNELGVESGLAASTPLPWHTDYSYLPQAARETFLEAVRLPEGGGGHTWFCNLYDAWETLPAARQAELQDLVGIHTIKGSGKHLERDDKVAMRTHQDRRNREYRYPGDRVPALHPLARRHPDTGRTALYVSSLVGGFEGVDEAAGLELIDELVAHATRPERLYAHPWREGDLIIFDDVGTMHRRDSSDPEQLRVMRQLSTMLTDTEGRLLHDETGALATV